MVLTGQRGSFGMPSESPLCHRMMNLGLTGSTGLHPSVARGRDGCPGGLGGSVELQQQSEPACWIK